jgi:hypothetical protein
MIDLVLLHFQIEPGIIQDMTDEDMAKYINKHGDRMAVRQYCQSRLTSIEPNGLSKIAQRLKSKMARKTDPCSKRNFKLFGNRNAEKDDRRYELGWMNYDGDGYKQVRERNGGGTRHLKGSKSITMEEILQTALNLFFPHGLSKKGKVEDFETTLQDCTEEEIPLSRSLNDHYELRKLKILRLYLCTKAKVDTCTSKASSKSDSDTDNASPERNQVPKRKKLSVLNIDSPKNIISSVVVGPCSSTSKNISSVAVDLSANSENNLDVAVKSDPNKAVPIVDNMSEAGPSKRKFPLVDLARTIKKIDKPVLEEDMDDDLPCVDCLNTEQKDDPHDGQCSNDVDNDLLDYALSLSMQSEQEIQFRSFESDAFDAEPFVPQNMGSEITILKLHLHRGHVFNELNEAIKVGSLKLTDISIEVSMLLPNGQLEQAEDSGGVWRDALSEYWDTFYKKCTTGNSVRVPVLRHDMKDTWTDIAKVLVIGMKTQGYFPVRLAKAFVYHCWGKRTPEKDLIKNFLQFVPEHEKDTIERRDFEDEEFLDLLDAHRVKSVVSEKTWDKILFEIAHKEIIQEPAYVAECWGPILQNHLTAYADGIEDLLSSLEPTPKKVIARLTFDQNLTSRERDCADYLKKFVRTSTKDLLQRFLRFCTGEIYTVLTQVYKIALVLCILFGSVLFIVRVNFCLISLLVI